MRRGLHPAPRAGRGALRRGLAGRRARRGSLRGRPGRRLLRRVHVHQRAGRLEGRLRDALRAARSLAVRADRFAGLEPAHRPVRDGGDPGAGSSSPACRRWSSDPPAAAAGCSMPISFMVRARSRSAERRCPDPSSSARLLSSPTRHRRPRTAARSCPSRSPPSRTRPSRCRTRRTCHPGRRTGSRPRRRRPGRS